MNVHISLDNAVNGYRILLSTKFNREKLTLEESEELLDELTHAIILQKAHNAEAQRVNERREKEENCIWNMGGSLVVPSCNGNRHFQDHYNSLMKTCPYCGKPLLLKRVV